MIASSRRSSWVASLLTSSTDVTSANSATTMAAASAAASATRVRSDTDRLSQRRTPLTAVIGLPSRFSPQHVSDPANRVDHARHPVALELAPQVADEHVGDIGVDVEVIPPHQLKQPL